MKRIMKSILLSSGLLLTATTLSFSHSVVTESNPENDALLDIAPEHIEVSFSKPTRIVKASLSLNNGTPIKLALSTKEPTKIIRFSPIPKIIGSYIVKWRALSEDGHALKGRLQFSITEPK